MRLKKGDEHFSKQDKEPAREVDIQNVPEGTMFIVQNGKLVAMPPSPQTKVTSQREAQASLAEAVPTNSDSASQVKSKFIHFFKVATED